jgi:hypothetical protein
MGSVVHALSSMLRGSQLAAQRLFLYRCEGPLEELIAQNVAFAIFSANDPFTRLDIREPEVGGDCSCFCALRGVDDDRPENAE